jgi:hypothetical protein
MKSYASFQNSIPMHMISKRHLKMSGSLTAYEDQSRAKNPESSEHFNIKTNTKKSNNQSLMHIINNLQSLSLNTVNSCAPHNYITDKHYFND